MEAFDFVGDALACDQLDFDPCEELGNLLSSEAPSQAREIVLKYWLRAKEKGHPELILLRPANLSECDLSGWKIKGLDLRGANLRNADLLGVKLHQVDLSGADLTEIEGRQLEVIECSLRNASCDGANFEGADLRESDFTNMEWGDTVSWDGVMAYQLVAAPSAISGFKETHLLQSEIQLQGHLGGANCCALSGDGRSLYSASADKTLRQWDVATGRCVQIFKGHSRTVRSCVLSGDGTSLYSASADKTLKQWDVATGRCLREWVMIGGEWIHLDENRELLEHSPEAWRVAHGVGRDPETQELRPFSLEYLKKG